MTIAKTRTKWSGSTFSPAPLSLSMVLKCHLFTAWHDTSRCGSGRVCVLSAYIAYMENNDRRSHNVLECAICHSGKLWQTKRYSFPLCDLYYSLAFWVVDEDTRQLPTTYAHCLHAACTEQIQLIYSYGLSFSVNFDIVHEVWQCCKCSNNCFPTSISTLGSWLSSLLLTLSCCKPHDDRVEIRTKRQNVHIHEVQGPDRQRLGDVCILCHVNNGNIRFRSSTIIIIIIFLPVQCLEMR